VHAEVVDGKRTFANPIGGAKRVLDRDEGELLPEIKMLIEAHCPELLAEHGCGTATAAIIIGHTAAAKRFPTDACFTRHAGSHRSHSQALCRTRTDDPFLTMEVLYQLS
jgi:hypothetical protein